MIRPKSIVATFTNEEKTESYHLQADGTLVKIVRNHTSDVWSPPIIIVRRRRRDS